MPKLDLKKFLNDPAEQESRDFLDGYITHFLLKREEEAKNKRKDKNAKQNIFDRIFGGVDDNDDGDDE